jgi:hypothetical protein
VADIDRETHREQGKAANARTWELLSLEARTAAEEDEMVHAAHASHWHWLLGGDAVNEQRGLWLLSRVYAVAGDGPRSLFYGRRCWELTERDCLTGFDRAYACEAMARATTLIGDAAASREWRASAEDAAASIEDLEDREIFDADYAAPPW